MSTKNYNLAQLELSNAANIPLLLNNTFETIDRGLTLNVGISSGTGNDYVLDLGSITLTEDNKGISFKFFADKTSNGEVTINGTYKLMVNPNKQFKKIIEGCPYTITYDGGTNFFLSSGGVDESDETTVGTDGSNVLEGHTFIGTDGEIHDGKMPERHSYSANIDINGAVDLPSGHYDSIHIGQSLNYHEGGWTPKEYGVYSDYFYQHLDTAYYKGAETRLPISTVARTLGFNENNVVGNVGGINGNGLELKFGTITINNTDSTNNTYSIDVSQLNLPKTPKFVTCKWTLTYSYKYKGSNYGSTVNGYTYFDWINEKCSYPVNTEWSHDSSGTYKIVDSIRNFTNKTTLYMHIESNNRYLIPTNKGDYSNFSRSAMTVNWTAIV